MVSKITIVSVTLIISAVYFLILAYQSYRSNNKTMCWLTGSLLVSCVLLYFALQELLRPWEY